MGSARQVRFETMKWKYILTFVALVVVAEVIRAGPGDIWRKIVFYGGAAAIVVLKISGLFITAISWWYVLILGAVGVVTDASSTAIDDARAIPLSSNRS